MASNFLRREVLNSFKTLHRTRCLIFQNDQKVLEAARKEINEGFKKNKNVTNVDSIKELIKFAKDVNLELKTTVVELEETTPGTFRMKLRPEMFENSNVENQKLSK